MREFGATDEMIDLQSRDESWAVKPRHGLVTRYLDRWRLEFPDVEIRGIHESNHVSSLMRELMALRHMLEARYHELELITTGDEILRAYNGGLGESHVLNLASPDMIAFTKNENIWIAEMKRTMTPQSRAFAQLQTAMEQFLPQRVERAMVYANFVAEEYYVNERGILCRTQNGRRSKRKNLMVGFKYKSTGEVEPAESRRLGPDFVPIEIRLFQWNN